MSYNNFLNNKTDNICEGMGLHYITDLQNRNSDDYFFNKSDLDKMAHFKFLTDRYKLCNKIYYFYNDLSNLWKEEQTEDSVVSRICDYTREILEPEKKFVTDLLLKKLAEYVLKKSNGSMTTDESAKFEELKESLKEWNKFIDRTIKDHQKTKFAKSVLNFFHHNIIDQEFMNKININNHHLLPLKSKNLNLITGKMENRIKEQFFTKALNFFDINNICTSDDGYKIVDNFFLDICTGSEIKKRYLQKILGYFLSGNVTLGRTFYIFYGDGKNGKSAIMEIVGEIFSHYCKAMEASIIIKKGMKNSGQASPEIEVLDYGLRLALLSETSEGDVLNEVLIKQISGYDPISYRALYGKQKDFRAEAKLCMLTNNKPYFKLSPSMVDRIRFLDFKSRFSFEEPKLDNEGNKIDKNYYKANPELVVQLKTIYKEYVLAWLVEGAKNFFKEGHMNVPDDEELIKENMSYINEMDSFKRFSDECLTITIDKTEKVLTSIVNERYKKFCVDEGIPPIKTSQLKQLLLKQFTTKKDSNNYFYGFKMKEDEEEDKPINALDM
jgi:P4 family phage/plasmid primase-like protien